ncbi:MAG: T9SS type A sorting domain-containing protein [Bacteroidetes bacterium]|nr:T9SS type A sorting domain-containing protein [Bacteroidota bacterium]
MLKNDYVTRLATDDSLQKAIQVLEGENTYDDQQTVFGTYICLGEVDSAAVKLELLNTSGLAETDWLALSEILRSLTSENKTWFDMSDGQANTLREMATDEENTLAKIQAQNVLHLVYGDTFPVVIDEEEIYLREMHQPKEETKIFSPNDNFQLYPNPANNNVEIKLNNNKELISNVVLINNLGNIVLKEKLDEKQSSYKLNTSQRPSGLYLLKIMTTSGTTYSNKLMIVK